MFYTFLYFRLQLLFELGWNDEEVIPCEDKSLEKDEEHIMQQTSQWFTKQQRNAQASGSCSNFSVLEKVHPVARNMSSV